MHLQELARKRTLFLSLGMIGIGVLLVVWLFGFAPAGNSSSSEEPTLLVSRSSEQPVGNAAHGEQDIPPTPPPGTPLPTPTATPVAITVGMGPGVPMRMITSTLSLTEVALSQITFVTTANTSVANTSVASNTYSDATLHFALAAVDGAPATTAASDFYTYTFAAATRFDTIDPAITSVALTALWQAGNGGTPTSTAAITTVTTPAAVESIAPPFTQIAALSTTIPALQTILDQPGSMVVGHATTADLVEAAWADRSTLVLIPFDLLSPRLAVLAIDGQTPVENAQNFDAATYPLSAKIRVHRNGTNPQEETAGRRFLAQLPSGNRLDDRLSVVAMTGVTAMVRLTAAEMDKRGYEWPAEFVGPLLRSADITAISNEVPFVPGCQTDTRMDNLTFCSKPGYMGALTASGVDIIGLTGNHQNDFGREDAVKSLDIYAAAGLPVYGGGRNKAEAFAPLYLEHNGNRLAFLGANSYGPTFAWATDDRPGSAEFDLDIMSATIRNIKRLGRAEVVFAELQYQETYQVTPLMDQRQNFNALVRAGADVVTGVQSHVPQAMEFTDGKLILYGLGNLFFDQMWSRATREGIIVKHTIYDNRHISTQVFTTLLYDYGQPRWTTPDEHAVLLQRVYDASYW